MDAPEPLVEPSPMPAVLPTLEAVDFRRVPEALRPVAFAPPAIVEAPVVARAAEVDTLAPGETEAEMAASDPCAAPGLLLCDTFEAATGGAFPDAEQWQPELPGCGTHVVDESAGASLSGSKALRTESGGYPECMLHADVEGETDVFVRSWIRLGSEPDLLTQYFSLLEWGPGENRDDPSCASVCARPAAGCAPRRPAWM